MGGSQLPEHRLPRILLVDDEPMVRAMLVRALQQGGYEVVALNDGGAALEAARTAAEPYDLVITNNYMPHLHGVELIKRLRERDPALPILHLDDLSDPKLSAVPPNVPNLAKPFPVDVMLDHVRTLLGERPRAPDDIGER